MTEQVLPGIYRIDVPLPDTPLKALNSWFIRGRDRDLLIDTGFRCDECSDALTAGLAEIGSDPGRRDVLITHLHSDHSGLADLFAAPDARIYISGADLAYMTDDLGEGCVDRIKIDYIEEGFPRRDLDEIFDVASDHFFTLLPKIDERYTPISHTDSLSVGDVTLEMIDAPGHTPGGAMFWVPERHAIFCGDHVLFDITPNITRWSDVDDSLGMYIASLERTRGIDADIALPGHRHGGDIRRRTDDILAHHASRLSEVCNIIAAHPGAAAYEIASMMTWSIRARDWSDFPPTQRWFAVGECMAHLDHLKASRAAGASVEGGIRRWRLI